MPRGSSPPTEQTLGQPTALEASFPSFHFFSHEVEQVFQVRLQPFQKDLKEKDEIVVVVVVLEFRPGTRTRMLPFVSRNYTHSRRTLDKGGG